MNYLILYNPLGVSFITLTLLQEQVSNKETYMLTPQENEEVKNQVQELLDKGLVREI
jgi:hypothetical protein